MLARMLILSATVGHFVLGLDTNVPFSMKTARFRSQCLPSFGDYLDLLDCYFSHRSSVAKTNPNTNSSLRRSCSCHRWETYHDVRATHGIAFTTSYKRIPKHVFSLFRNSALSSNTLYGNYHLSPRHTFRTRKLSTCLFAEFCTPTRFHWLQTLLVGEGRKVTSAVADHHVVDELHFIGT